MPTKSKAKPLGKSLTVKSSNGKKSRFTKNSCSKLKTDAKKKQKSIKERGFRAIIKKDPVRGTWCVFKGPKSKSKIGATSKKRKTTTRKRRTTQKGR